MSLSQKQFQELRDKGLSVDQIVSFEKGQKPEVRKQDVKLWDTSGFTSGFKGIGKGLGKLALGVGTIGRGIQRAVTPKSLEADVMGESVFDIGSQKRAEAETALTSSNKGEKIASTITEIGATMLPSGSVYKATKGLGFAMKMLGRGAGGAVTGTVQGGGDIDKDTAIGAAAETVIPFVGGKVLGYGGSVLKGLTGMVSGKGSDVIEQIIKNPKGALAGGNAPSSQVLKETATSIRTGVQTIRKNAGDLFEEQTKNFTKPLNKKVFKEAVDEFMNNVNETSFISTAKLDKVKGVVDTWDDYSPQGLNKLASKISKFYSGSDAAKDIDGVVSGLNRTIRNWVGKQVPEILEANAKYADKMDLIEQMEAIFRTKGSVEGRLGLQKTAQSIGQLFNANKDIAREGVEEIEKELGINILGKEAGRQLVDGVSRSQGAIGDFATGVSKALLPPKLLLNLTAATGIAKGALESKLDLLEPAARATTIEFLTDLFGEGEKETQ